jgi:arylsulfatase A-like enzyme
MKLPIFPRGWSIIGKCAYLALLSAACLFLLQACGSQKTEPNILLISADDLGWSDLGCYGSEIETPHIDDLARGGMRFTQFHNTAKCFPSRACLLTGIYAQQCGYDRDYRQPIQNAVTLGEVLRQEGYITLWSGKHHGIENPVTLGFDHYYGLRDGACNYFNPGDQRPGESPPARKGPTGNKRVRAWCDDSLTFLPYTPSQEDFYTTDYFTDRALEWLDEYNGDKRPVFLYMAYTAPHDPLMAWPRDIGLYEGRYDEGYGAIRQERYRRQLEMGLIDSTYRLSAPTYRDWASLSDSAREAETRKMEVYAAMIHRLDFNVGRVIEKLVETGRADDLLVLFVSDNGASAELVSIEDDFGEIGTMTRWSSLGPDWANVCNTPFRYYKNYSHEGGTNTPLIACWPGKIEGGTFSSFPGHFIDIMATVVDLTGARYPRTHHDSAVVPMQGRSLMPAFMGYPVKRKKPLFWEWSDGCAVREGDWKLVKWGPENPWELYDLGSDPTETEDLATGEPERVSRMEEQFRKWKTANQ